MRSLHHLVLSLALLVPSGGCAFIFDNDDDHPTSTTDTATTHPDTTTTSDATAMDTAQDTAESPPFVALTENRKRPSAWQACVHANADGTALVTTDHDGLVVLDPETLAAERVTLDLEGPRVEVWTTPDPRWVWLMTHAPGAWKLMPLDLDNLVVGPALDVGGDVRVAEDRDAVWSARRVAVYRADSDGRYIGLRIYALPADPATFDPSATLVGARNVLFDRPRDRAWARLAPDASTRWLAVTTAHEASALGSLDEAAGFVLDLDVPASTPLPLNDPPLGPVTFHPSGQYLESKGQIVDLTGALPVEFLMPCTVVAFDASGSGGTCISPSAHAATDVVTLSTLDLATRALTPRAQYVTGVGAIADLVIADSGGSRWLLLENTQIFTGLLAVVDARSGPDTATWTAVSPDVKDDTTSEILTVPGRGEVWYRTQGKGVARYAFDDTAAAALAAGPVDGLDWAQDPERLIVCDDGAARVRSVDPHTGAVYATFRRTP